MSPPVTSADIPSRAARVVETVQTVLTALMLAFVFRAFWVEAFVIPTGSMSPSLHGAHVTRTCPVCGWECDVAPSGDFLCPNCHVDTPMLAGQTALKAGDRILVHKWPFMLTSLLGPRRWDVIVFRNPSTPRENYIKRVVGLPGERVEILDGDVFVNGRVARKTSAAQSALWFVVYDQDYAPHPGTLAAAAPRWREVKPTGDSALAWAGLESRVICCQARDAQEHAIRFAPRDQRYFQDVCPFNHGPSPTDTPFVGDLRMAAEVTFRGGDGSFRWELLRDEKRFIVEIRRAGDVSLQVTPSGQVGGETELHRRQLPRFRTDRPYWVEVGHLDCRVYLKIDADEILSTTDADYAPDLDELRGRRRTAPVTLRLAARSLDLELRGLRVERDVYYTFRPGRTQRAYSGHPFTLGADEYFVLGDNSPDSRDSREWSERGPHLPREYRLGTVPRDQIVGLAAFVYLPGLLPLDTGGKWRLPDVGRVRFVR